MAKSRFEYVREFERATDGGTALPRTFMVVRIDGRSFHRFSADHSFRKPVDIRALSVMNAAAQDVMREFGECCAAYGESDEFSFVLKRDCNLFGRRMIKIVSTMTSLFAAAYVFHWGEFMRDEGGESAAASAAEWSDAESMIAQQERQSLPLINDGAQGRDDTGTRCENVPGRLVPLRYPPAFDGRVVCYPSLAILRDYMSWRQADCHINHLYNVCFWALIERGGLTERKSEDRLKGTLSKDKHELLHAEFGINYNNEPAQFRKGTILVRVEDTVPVLDARSGQHFHKRVKEVRMLHDDLISEQFWTDYRSTFE